MMIVVKTLYTLQGYKLFLRLLYKKVRIFSYITSFLLFSAGLILMFLQLKGYVYVVFSLSLPFFVQLFINSMENDAMKKNALLISATLQTFCFEDNKFILTQSSRIGEFKEEYFYSELFSIYKTKDYYFLFVNRTQAFIVDINGFIQGNEK